MGEKKGQNDFNFGLSQSKEGHKRWEEDKKKKAAGEGGGEKETRICKKEEREGRRQGRRKKSREGRGVLAYEANGGKRLASQRNAR